MAALNVLAAASWLAAASLSSSSPADRWAIYVSEASARFGVPEEWIRRVIVAESNGRELIGRKPVTSPAGAMGLMQLMPGTWAEMTRIHSLGSDPYEPRSNILAGTAYLKAMYQAFGYPGLYGAYNAGPQRYAAYLAGRRPLPQETLRYLHMTTTPRSFAQLGAIASRTLPGRANRAHSRLFALAPLAPTVLMSQPDPLFAIRR